MRVAQVGMACKEEKDMVTVGLRIGDVKDGLWWYRSRHVQRKVNPLIAGIMASNDCVGVIISTQLLY